MKRKYSGMSVIALAVAVTLISSVLFSYFILYIQKNTESEKSDILYRSAENNMNSIKNHFNTGMVLLKPIINALGREDFSSESASSLLDDIIKGIELEDAFIYDKEGNTYFGKETNYNIDYDSFSDSVFIEGKEWIKYINPVNSAPYIILAVPIKDTHSNVSGALTMVLNKTELSEFLNLNLSNDFGVVKIIKSTGTVVIDNTATHSNIFDELIKNKYQDEYIQLKNDLTTGKSGIIQYTPDTYGIYLSLGVNDWHIFNVIPKSNLDIKGNHYQEKAILLGIVVALLVLFFITSSYFILRRDKKLFIKNEKEKHTSNNIFRFVTEMSDSIIFEWLPDNHMNFYNNNNKGRFYGVLEAGFFTETEATKVIHPDDVASFLQNFAQIFENPLKASFEFRLLDKDGVYFWCKMNVRSIYEDDKLLKLVGKISDIDKRKRQIDHLIDKAERDPVTGLYNKIVTENFIVSTLKEKTSGTHALMMIDIDDLKKVNDKYGHQKGDSIIAALAKVLKRQFRTDDIIGRVGGDEFMVFLQNIYDTSIVAGNASAICEAFHKINNNINKNDFSISIGISLYPKDAYNFSDLYSLADEALYEAKKKGKDRFEFANK